MSKFGLVSGIMADVTQTRYAKSGPVHIAYHVQGDAGLDLLWIFGGAIPLEATLEEPRITRFRDRLASFTRLVSYDRRGVGLSDPVASWDSVTLEERAADALAVLDAIGSERAAVLATDYTSGSIAIILAATYPSRVSSLVLNNPTPRIMAAPDYPWGISPEDVVSLADGMRRAIESGDSGSIGLFVPGAVDDRLIDWWVRSVRRGMRPGSVDKAARMIFAADVREVLHIVQAPTLIIHDVGNETWKFQEHARYAEERIPGARRVELPGSHVHVYASDLADRFLDEIEAFLTGVRRGPEPDRVLATVLFTDIVGSTAHAASMGDRAWRALLDDHDAMVRRQLDRFAGSEIDTTGDGFLASFHGPAQAIRCAVSIRNGAGQLGIGIRAGVHTGEVELRGQGIGGIAVHIGARVSALAGDGEVLVSSTVKDLVVGSGIEFDERGSHQLKGVPGEWRLFAVKE